ncbi:hypothetical protein NPIL_300101 [Nephila pilipes]|uniref:Uncharacterized protein n=1 Tax=Nephila pilipes TaxID=299642 RepID=A0A8X6U3K8_NEPPI|nr:hypothetical protein NPIL_300101 [Nephila pilipes]
MFFKIILFSSIPRFTVSNAVGIGARLIGNNGIKGGADQVGGAITGGADEIANAIEGAANEVGPMAIGAGFDELTEALGRVNADIGLALKRAADQFAQAYTRNRGYETYQPQAVPYEGRYEPYVPQGGSIKEWTGISMGYCTLKYILKGGGKGGNYEVLNLPTKHLLRLYTPSVCPDFHLMDDNAYLHGANIVEE